MIATPRQQWLPILLLAWLLIGPLPTSLGQQSGEARVTSKDDVIEIKAHTKLDSVAAGTRLAIKP